MQRRTRLDFFAPLEDVLEQRLEQAVPSQMWPYREPIRRYRPSNN